MNCPNRYGIGYKGSKNRIAERLLERMPSARDFVDLFAGGCAMTHCALVSGKFSRVHFNDINPLPTRLFCDAIEGKLAAEKRFISREDFQATKDSDPYAAICWSFGNNCDEYLWNRDTEGAKLLACKMILSDTWQERLAFYRKFILYLQKAREELKWEKERREDNVAEIEAQKEATRSELCAAFKASGLKYSDVDRHLGTQMSRHYFGKSQWAFPTAEAFAKLREILPTLRDYETYSLASLERLENLERLESLESIESLESLRNLRDIQRLNFLQSIARQKLAAPTCKHYSDVEIPSGAVVYADPPYRGTSDYLGEQFDSDAFFEWARTLDFPVFISEYSAPNDFCEIVSIDVKSIYASSSNSGARTEKLFIHKNFVMEYLEKFPKHQEQNLF